MGAGAGTRTRNLLFTRQLPIVHGVPRVLSLLLRSGGSSSLDAPVGPSTPWWNDCETDRLPLHQQALARRSGGYTPAHGRPFRTPACPGQSWAARVQPGPVLQRRRLRHRHHPADRRSAGARRGRPAVRPATPRHPSPDRRVRPQLRRDRAVLDGPPQAVPPRQGPELDPDAAQLAVPGLHRVPALFDRPAQRGRRPGAGNDLLRRHRRRRAGRGRGVAVRDPHPRPGPPRHLARGAPLGAAADPPGPRVVLLSIPVAITRPDLAKFLWLLVFVSGLALRRLEPADEEPATTNELGG